MTDNEQKKQEEPEHGRAWQNIGKTFFLVVALAAAWFLMDWLAGQAGN